MSRRPRPGPERLSPVVRQHFPTDSPTDPPPLLHRLCAPSRSEDELLAQPRAGPVDLAEALRRAVDELGRQAPGRTDYYVWVGSEEQRAAARAAMDLWELELVLRDEWGRVVSRLLVPGGSLDA